jgi:hypothetical protein
MIEAFCTERAFFTSTRFKPHHHCSKYGIAETIFTGQPKPWTVA